VTTSDAALARVLLKAPPGSIDLSGGEPDFATPSHIVDAGVRALTGGATKYTPRAGVESLREAIVEKLARRNGYEARVDDVIVTAGGTPATCIAIASTCSRGDAILGPDPGWPNYQLVADSIGIESRRYRQPPSGALDLDEIERLVDGRTKLIVVNSPSNPTGAMISRPDLTRLIELAERHRLAILADEAYEDIVFEGEAVSPAAIGGTVDVFSCYTLSKSYAMTGWRVGYIVVPGSASRAAMRVQTAITGCASAMAQHAAEVAITGPQTFVSEMCSAYRRRRDLAVEILQRAKLIDAAPQGAFYLWVDVASSGLSGADFARALMTDRKVVVSAGDVYSTFPTPATHVRASFATAEENVLNAARELADAVQQAAP
jgi:aspartate/methionine/tyrosine aminotransferase